MMAARVGRTDTCSSGKSLSYWRDVICENLLQMHIQSSQERAFFGHIEKHALGPIKANFISVSEQKVWRERTAACNAKDHLFHLIHVRKGVQLAEQYGRNLKVEAGDCLLIDCLAGFEFDFPQGVEALVLEIREIGSELATRARGCGGAPDRRAQRLGGDVGIRAGQHHAHDGWGIRVTADSGGRTNRLSVGACGRNR